MRVLESFKKRLHISNGILSLSKCIYLQLKALEQDKFDRLRDQYDCLIIIQTSIYTNLIINLYHLLSDDKHSISSLLKNLKGIGYLTSELEMEMQAKLESNRDAIQKLKTNRDKRIGHFDKKDILPLDNQTIDSLLDLAERQLLILNSIIGKTDNCFGIALSWDLNDVLDILNRQLFLKNT